MTDPTPPASEDPTAETPALSPPAPATPARPHGPSLGHIVLGAVLVLIGVGWLLEALDLADVPWRFLLPSVLILVGVALVLGARTGRHGGLIAVGVVLTVLVLLAGAVEVLLDVPLAGGVGDQSHAPTATAAGEYRWGLGKMTLDLTRTPSLAGRDIAASVVVGELVVIVPDDVPLAIEARAGLGEVNVLGTTESGVDPALECSGTGRAVECGDRSSTGELSLRLDLEVAVGRVEVRR